MESLEEIRARAERAIPSGRLEMIATAATTSRALAAKFSGPRRGRPIS